jgi:hypothetical protein
LPYIVLGKDESGHDAAYAVWVWRTEKLAKIALAIQDAYVVYDGHANFGLGFAFKPGLTTISQFMNVSRDLVAIEWKYLREQQGDPNFWVADKYYGDDVTTPADYDPVRYYEDYVAEHDTYTADKYSSEPLEGGDNLTFHPDYTCQKWLDYHYYDGYQPVLVVKGGCADMPAKNWKKIFINACKSGKYYYDIFDHGTLFFMTSETMNLYRTKLYVEAVIGGSNNGGIYNALTSEVQNCDYIEY